MHRLSALDSRYIAGVHSVAGMKPSDLVKGLAVVATTCALVYGGGGQAAQGQLAVQADDAPDEPAMFVDNDPNGSKAEQFRIRDYLVNLIEGAEDGTVITIASYRFTDTKVSDALVDAMKPERGVKVRVIVDGADADTTAYKDVAAAAKDPSWIDNCGEPAKDSKGNKHTSCIGDHIMHNKFYLFEKTHGKSNVVMQTSSNLSEHSGPKMWNTAYTAIGEKWLYDKYQDYFVDLHGKLDNADYYSYFNNIHAPTEQGKYKMYVSPRKESSSTITFANILKNVECRGNTSGGTGDNDGNRTIVRVAAAQIAGPGGTGVAAELWKLDNKGCYVDIVGTEVSQKKGGPLRGGLLRAPTGEFHGPEVREFSTKQCGTHEKNILIDGFYAGNPNQKVVFTGSHNLNNKSPWHNDEVILRITDPDVHEAFKKHFFKVREAAAITWQTSKYSTTNPDDLEFNCPPKN